MHSTTKRSAVLAGVAALVLGAVTVPGIAPMPAHAAPLNCDELPDDVKTQTFMDTVDPGIYEGAAATSGIDENSTVLEACGRVTLVQGDGKGITDLKGIENLVLLETLDIDGNDVTDLSPATGLARLKTLWANGNKIANLPTDMSGLTSLEDLDLGGNELSGSLPDGISTLHNLMSLDVSMNELTNINMVSALTGLTAVHASHNQIVNASFVATMDSLVTLDLRNNEIESIPTPAQNSELRELMIGQNHIWDLQPLERILMNLTSFEGEGQTVDLGTVEIPSGATSTVPTARIPAPELYAPVKSSSPAGGTFIENIGEVAWENVTQAGPFSVDFSANILPTRVVSPFSGTITQQVNIIASAIATWEFQNGSPALTQAVEVGQSITPPHDPTHVGYTFAGWAMDAAGTQPAKFPFTMNADATFYAQWTPVPGPTPGVHTVTFDAQGGTPAPAPQQVENGKQAAMPAPAPTRDGYRLLGWSLTPEGGTLFDFTTPITEPTTLYAQWELVPAPNPTPEPTPGPVADTGAAGVRMAAGLAGTLITAGIGAIGISGNRRKD